MLREGMLMGINLQSKLLGALVLYLLDLHFLLSVNGFVTLTKFTMETASSVLGSVKEGDGMFLIDLKDAYVQIPVLTDSWH